MIFASPTYSSPMIASFFWACMEECDAVAGCLSSYSAASRQVINFSKSEICYGSDVQEDGKVTIATRLDVVATHCHQCYLGLPSFTGKR